MSEWTEDTYNRLKISPRTDIAAALAELDRRAERIEKLEKILKDVEAASRCEKQHPDANGWYELHVTESDTKTWCAAIREERRGEFL